MKAAIYIRVSTDEQTEGYSIDDQKRRLTSFADSQDWEISEYYIDDGYSAKDLNRPAIKELMNDVALNKFDIVLIYKLNRLIRSASDCDYLLKLFERHNVKFQSCVESYETRTAAGRLFIRLMADIAQFERENIAENVRNGMEQMVLEGERPGGPVPFGYDKEEKIIHDEYLICRELRRLYMEESLGLKAIAMELNERGMTRRNGQPWSSVTVWYVLDNPYYAGKIRWGGKKKNGKYATRKKEDMVKCIIVDGKQELTFTLEEYTEHQSEMKRRSFTGYSKQREYWFSGVLRCSRCGSSMSGRYHQNKRKDGSHKKIMSYICSSRQTGTGCDMPMFRQELVESLVMNYIGQIILDKDLLDKGAKSAPQASKIEIEIDLMKNELVKTQERKRKWQKMFMESLDTDDATLTEQEMRAFISDERKKEEILTNRISELQKSMPKETSTEGMEALHSLPEIWKMLEDDDKKQLVLTVFEKIVLYTSVTKPHGKKGQFIPASIQEVVFA